VTTNSEKGVAPEDGSTGKGGTGMETETTEAAPGESSSSGGLGMGGHLEMLGLGGLGSGGSGKGSFGLGNFGKSFGKGSSSGGSDMLSSIFGGFGSGSTGGGVLGGFGKSNGGGSSPFSGFLGGFGKSTQNDMNGDFSCKKIALLFARGTLEPGNMGYMVGPPLASALKQAYPNEVLIKGINYPGTCCRQASKIFESLLIHVRSRIWSDPERRTRVRPSYAASCHEMPQDTDRIVRVSSIINPS
jgi:hypothetical protein